MLQVVSALQREMAELRNKTTGYENKLAALESNNRDSLSKIRVLETELTELKVPLYLF
jgi:chromosome segregation ATPase